MENHSPENLVKMLTDLFEAGKITNSSLSASDIGRFKEELTDLFSRKSEAASRGSHARGRRAPARPTSSSRRR